ncbi:MAG: hypothetical protein AAF490_04015 [Chloroflexota bacterium]
MMPLRSLRRLLRGVDLPDPFSRLTAAHQAAALIVRLYYAFIIFLFSDDYMRKVEEWVLLDASDLLLLWPVGWVTWVGVDTAVYAISLLLIGGAVLSLLWPEKRPFRLAAFVGLFLIMAIENSFGKINHSMHAWLAVGFCFIFLPTGKPVNRVQRVTYLTTFWYAQALMLWFYSMSGIWKVNQGFAQLFAGEISAFHPYAMAQQIANRLLQDNSTSILGPFIVENPLIGWPVYLSALYLEFFSFVAAFRPALHRFWGLSLALFHLGTFLTMSIQFNQNILLLGLILMASPFHPASWRWQDTIRDLPILGWVYGKLWALSQAL